ncbi:pyrimidine permease [Mucor ambiguus]|uniref:Pyrimidine permease n=1 Tax=Mucor ambiguus TaxID=91626 RepID=A0A0C9LV78_9FUNG|nr:pyrimidine permease [Mucor ambiguus]
MNLSTSNQPQDSSIHILHDKESSNQDLLRLTFDTDQQQHGWKYALQHYFPHYTYQPIGTVQIEERPGWFYCIAYGIQHVLAMFSGVIVLPLILGYDSNITGGRVPSYLGCSGSFVSIILTISNYTSTSNSEMNTNTATVQGAILVLSLAYAAVAIAVMVFGYKWLEFFMPPMSVVTGSIITSIGLHLSFLSYDEAVNSSFDTYLAIATASAVMLVSVYAPTNALRRIALLLGTMTGYFIHAMCNLRGIGPSIDYSEIASNPWIRAPSVYFNLKFDSRSIGMVMPILIVLLAENLGHMKAIGSITHRPMLRYVGRAYLGDALGCFVASLTGAVPFTTYAENIGVLSVTQVFSPLVILFASVFAMLLGFFAKFSAIVKSIPHGVLGGVTAILYTLIAITGVRIWVVNKVDFNDTRNIFVGGLPVILATVMQTPLQVNNFQLDGIGVATFGSIILYQVLQGYDGLAIYKKNLGAVKDISEGIK